MREKEKRQIDIIIPFNPTLNTAEGQRGGVIEVLATIGSIVLMVLTFPISVFICFKGMLMSSHGRCSSCVNIYVEHNVTPFNIAPRLRFSSCAGVWESRHFPDGWVGAEHIQIKSTTSSLLTSFRLFSPLALVGRLRSGGARGMKKLSRGCFHHWACFLPGPGVFFVLPCVDNYCKVDLRTVCESQQPRGLRKLRLNEWHLTFSICSFWCSASRSTHERFRDSFGWCSRVLPSEFRLCRAIEMRKVCLKLFFSSFVDKRSIESGGASC